MVVFINIKISTKNKVNVKVKVNEFLISKILLISVKIYLELNNRINTKKSKITRLLE